MSSLNLARALYGIKNKHNMGNYLKQQSNQLMEASWWNDIQSKKCYIYDYFHDDQPRLMQGMTYENTTKTPIDAKFIVTKYMSLGKDQVEFHLQFRPSQPVNFNSGDPLYYYETDYRDKYWSQFPIGLYVDVPNSEGVYQKWLIVDKEEGNQFIKYLILPCNYELNWIEKKDSVRIKRRMWCVLRTQSSYNSGLWTDYVMTTQQNQHKVWLPMNSITANIWYTDEEDKNMRMIVGAPTDFPVVWKVSKVENAEPLGIQKLTLYQCEYNQHKDYIEKDENGNVVGMWADYYEYHDEIVDPEIPAPIVSKVECKIKSSTPTLKIGGSYKTLTAEFYDLGGNDISDNYKDAEMRWIFMIDGQNVENIMSIVNGNSIKIKIKFPNDRSYLNKALDVQCQVIAYSSITGHTKLELSI